MQLKSAQVLWRIAGFTALLATVLFIVGFALAADQIWFPKAADGAPIQSSSPTPTSGIDQADKLQIVALGDSLTVGTGDNLGKGYVGRAREKLERELGKPVYILNNLAIPGYRTDQVLRDLALSKTQDAIADADLVLLTIGGNDLFAGGEGLFGAESEFAFNPEAARARMTSALGNMDKTLAAIHQANPDALVLYVGLYHPFLDLDLEQEGSLIVQQWNDSVFAMLNRYPNAVLVPTYDLFALHLNKYLSADHFHPNGDGYERIAERIAQIVK